jgi:acylphosphatase
MADSLPPSGDRRLAERSMSVARTAAEIIVEGRVQGVGYRDYVRRRALGLGLVGYVMNLKDGRVRVHAEGAREVIEDLRRQLEKGPPLSRVDSIDVRWVVPGRRFASFEIRYSEFEP